MDPTMRAAFFESPGVLTVREVPIPEPDPGDVRVRVRYCGICGSDVSLFKSGALAGPDTVLGHEIVAVVDLDPEGRWQPGARVAPYPLRRCGRCAWCLGGTGRYCVDPPLDRWGGFAEYACYPGENLVPVPDDVEDGAAAVIEPLGVAVRAVDEAAVEAGDTVYVAGLGSIGLLTVSALAARGCRVIGADPREERRAIAIHLGCEEAFDPLSEDPVDRVSRFDPREPRAVFECSGAPESLQLAFDACAPGGVVAIVGIPAAPVLLLRMTLKEQRAFSLSGPTKETMERAAALLRERPDTAGVVTGAVPLEGAGPAMQRLAAGDGGIKVLVRAGA